jgi:hypothetical protein
LASTLKPKEKKTKPKGKQKPPTAAIKLPISQITSSSPSLASNHTCQLKTQDSIKKNPQREKKLSKTETNNQENVDDDDDDDEEEEEIKNVKTKNHISRVVVPTKKTETCDEKPSDLEVYMNNKSEVVREQYKDINIGVLEKRLSSICYKNQITHVSPDVGLLLCLAFRKRMEMLIKGTIESAVAREDIGRYDYPTIITDDPGAILKQLRERIAVEQREHSKHQQETKKQQEEAEKQRKEKEAEAAFLVATRKRKHKNPQERENNKEEDEENNGASEEEEHKEKKKEKKVTKKKKRLTMKEKVEATLDETHRQTLHNQRKQIETSALHNMLSTVVGLPTTSFTDLSKKKEISNYDTSTLKPPTSSPVSVSSSLPPASLLPDTNTEYEYERKKPKSFSPYVGWGRIRERTPPLPPQRPLPFLIEPAEEKQEEEKNSNFDITTTPFFHDTNQNDDFRYTPPCIQPTVSLPAGERKPANSIEKQRQLKNMSLTYQDLVSYLSTDKYCNSIRFAHLSSGVVTTGCIN